MFSPVAPTHPLTSSLRALSEFTLSRPELVEFKFHPYLRRAGLKKWTQDFNITHQAGIEPPTTQDANFDKMTDIGVSAVLLMYHVMGLVGGWSEEERCCGEEKREGETERQTRTSKTRLHQSVALIHIISIIRSERRFQIDSVLSYNMVVQGRLGKKSQTRG